MLWAWALTLDITCLRKTEALTDGSSSTTAKKRRSWLLIYLSFLLQLIVLSDRVFMGEPNRNSNDVPSEKSNSETDYFRENPGKSAISLVASLLIGFVVGAVVFFSMMRLFSIEPYLSIVFSSPVSVIIALYSNSTLRNVFIKKSG